MQAWAGRPPPVHDEPDTQKRHFAEQQQYGRASNHTPSLEPDVGEKAEPPAELFHSRSGAQ